MKKRAMKIISTLFVTLIIGSIAFLLFVTYQSHKNPSEIPSFFGYKPLTVLTNSMVPKISAGDMILVKETESSSLTEGDVITFQLSDKTLITHRIVKVNDGSFTTKGDNNNVADEWEVKPQDILGQVEYTIPNAGYAAKFVTSKLGFSLFVLFPLLLFVLIEVYQRVFRYLDKRDDTAANDL
ncbi:signal peptidase I [Bacillus salacetis]|uniref:Signal peptidase I n=1 Tax=Bacillus salacetis TaxID=2315464 RepID=A0A3A1QV30_9BACI|nr:signal peptidase I [Bacillus salacetis]RIW31829.1 signal peptidase I [Bacillus salacetis]